MTEVAGVMIRVAAASELERLFEQRWRVLRAPLGMERGTERDAGDDQSLHLIAVQEQTVIGGARLRVLSSELGSLAYVFVLPDYQRQGIGTQLIQAAIEQAISLNLSQLRVMTRLTAQSFYERLGFVATSDLFDYVGIPHRFLSFKLPVQ
jgi:N-acetylglutamate synthase-like GNAT family acetyltransferase